MKFVWLTFTDNMFGLVVFMVKHLYLNQLIQFISTIDDVLAVSDEKAENKKIKQ